MRMLSILLFASSAATFNITAAEPTIIVDAGVSVAPIVVYADAPLRTRAVADELADYIEKTSGARPEVVEGEPDPLPKAAIWVGYQPVLETLMPELDFNFEHPEEILIAAANGHLVVAGRDRWVPGHTTVMIRGNSVEGKQQEYGTINAVYTFLQDQLGVRWLWPGELGEDIQPRRTIAFEPFVYRYHPQIRHRHGVMAFSSIPGWGYGRSHDWVRRQRLQLDSLEMSGHAFMDWAERFGESNPEYFALQPDGRRGVVGRPTVVKMCEANPDVWQQWLETNVRERLAEDPTRRLFGAAHNDNWATGYCTCDDCRAWDHPDAELRTFRWPGLALQMPAISDRHVTFANTLARLLNEEFPEEDYHVTIMAYGHTRPAPMEAVPDDNVIVASVANFFGRRDLVDGGYSGSEREQTHRQQFLAWGEIAPKLIWRPNTGSPVGAQQGQPDIFLQEIIEDWRMIAEAGCIGIWIDMIWEHWSTQGVQYYLMAQLTWNPWQDGQAVLDDYYSRGFGPAADAVKQYWTLLEEVRTEYYYERGARDYPEIYNDSLFARATTPLDEAQAAVGGYDEKYRARIDFLRFGLDYTRQMIRLREAMGRHRAGDETAGDDARAIWDDIAALEVYGRENLPHAINWGPLRRGTPRMRGLNPDHVKVGSR